MKKRVKIDSSILSVMVLLTGCLYLFPYLYPKSVTIDNIFDCLGIILVLKGILLRMSARGHKKSNSSRGGSLVMGGPYQLTRNPMYLGSYLIGAGFVLLVWPWWALAVFTAMFYMRFNQQMVKEENHLVGLFGAQYSNYIKTVPRIFPGIAHARSVKTKEIFNLQEAFSTKEQRNLWLWPLLAVFLESFQEILIYGRTDLNVTVVQFAVTVVVFAVGFGIAYRFR